MLRRLYPLLLLLLLCAKAQAAVLRVGALPGPPAEVLTHVGTLAAQSGELALSLRTYQQPEALRRALLRGEIDAASLDDGVAFARANPPNSALTVAATTLTLPMALYGHGIARLSALPRRARVDLPAEPGLQARALILLHNYGLIGLRDGAGFAARLSDVTANPRQLQLHPAAARHTGRTQAELSVLDYAQANAAGLAPARDALGLEDGHSPYAGVLVVRQRERDAHWLRQLIQIYRSDATQRFILEHYQDSVRRPW